MRVEAGTELDPDAAEVGPHAPLIRRLCRSLSELSPQPMVAVEGTTHVVIYANPAFARLAGKDCDSLAGLPFTEAVPEGDANGCAALLDRVYRTGTSEGIAEQEHRQPQARPVYWSYLMWAILGPDSRPAGVMVQVTESTENANFRREAVAVNEALIVSATRQHELTEEARAAGARLQGEVYARDHFLAALSHELRNPLAPLRNGLYVLKQAGGNPAAAGRTLAVMDRQLNQLVRLVDDLLDVSRIATGKLTLRRERVDLESVVRDAVEASRGLIEGQGHELAVTLPPDPVALDADPARLAQVLTNLLNNAAKYSDRGGRVGLTATRDGGVVVVSVTDTGVGIPAADLLRVFDAFIQVDAEWRRAQGGMGIGLSLVKEFVTLHGGTVEARSDGPGRGSEFVVRLPAPAALPEVLDGVPAAPGAT